jgi:hypothetical protein
MPLNNFRSLRIIAAPRKFLDCPNMHPCQRDPMDLIQQEVARLPLSRNVDCDELSL